MKPICSKGFEFSERGTATTIKSFLSFENMSTSVLTSKSNAGILVLIFFSLSLVGCSTWKVGSAGQRKTAGKTFVILGASSGFGRGVAEELGAYKANVVLAARRTEV